MEKKPVNVDEDAIKGMMRGDIPLMRSAPAKPAEAASELPPTSDYGAIFLHRRPSEPKRQTYISAEHFAKITKVIAVLAAGLTVPAFLDNLIANHLEQYKDEVNGLYAEKTEKPL